MINIETPETVAELLTLAKEGRERPYTEVEKTRIGELCALSMTPTSSDPDDAKGLGVIVFWTTLANGKCSEETRTRDKNIVFIKDLVVPHLIRVTNPHVQELINQARGEMR